MPEECIGAMVGLRKYPFLFASCTVKQFLVINQLLVVRRHGSIATAVVVVVDASFSTLVVDLRTPADLKRAVPAVRVALLMGELVDVRTSEP